MHRSADNCSLGQQAGHFNSDSYNQIVLLYVFQILRFFSFAKILYVKFKNRDFGNL